MDNGGLGELSKLSRERTRRLDHGGTKKVS